MKEELIEAAERAFRDAGENGITWWGYLAVTKEPQYRFVRDKVVSPSDSGAYADGKYAVWLLLLAAEFYGRN